MSEAEEKDGGRWREGDAGKATRATARRKQRTANLKSQGTNPKQISNHKIQIPNEFQTAIRRSQIGPGSEAEEKDGERWREGDAGKATRATARRKQRTANLKSQGTNPKQISNHKIQIPNEFQTAIRRSQIGPGSEAEEKDGEHWREGDAGGKHGKGKSRDQGRWPILN